MTNDENIGNYGYIGTSILRIYRYFDFTNIENIEKISMNIFSQISVGRKLFKIHRNVWKNSKKNDKISKNTHFKVIV